MTHVLTASHVAEAISVLCGTYDVVIGNRPIRLLGRWLPGTAVCAILPEIGDGIMRVVFDPEKPGAYRHTRRMLSDWWEAETGERLCPEADERPRLVEVRV